MYTESNIARFLIEAFFRIEDVPGIGSALGAGGARCRNAPVIRTPATITPAKQSSAHSAKAS